MLDSASLGSQVGLHHCEDIQDGHILTGRSSTSCNSSSNPYPEILVDATHPHRIKEWEIWKYLNEISWQKSAEVHWNMIDD